MKFLLSVSVTMLYQTGFFYSCFQFYIAYDQSKYVELVPSNNPANISTYNDSKPLLTVSHGKGNFLLTIRSRQYRVWSTIIIFWCMRLNDDFSQLPSTLKMT